MKDLIPWGGSWPHFRDLRREMNRLFDNAGVFPAASVARNRLAATPAASGHRCRDAGGRHLRGYRNQPARLGAIDRRA